MTSSNIDFQRYDWVDDQKDEIMNKNSDVVTKAYYMCLAELGILMLQINQENLLI